MYLLLDTEKGSSYRIALQLRWCGNVEVFVSEFLLGHDVSLPEGQSKLAHPRPDKSQGVPITKGFNEFILIAVDKSLIKLCVLVDSF